MTMRRKVEMVRMRMRTRSRAMLETAYLYKGGSMEYMYSTQVRI